jgi:cytochrome c553
MESFMKLIIFVLLISVNVYAADAPKIASTCAACHGEKGVSQNPLWPNLAGQKSDYLLKQLHDFKSGKRQDPIMSPMASTLSEQDMTELAQYFSKL